MSEWVNNVAEICISKAGNKPYLKVKKNVELREGDNLIMKTFGEEQDSLVKNGVITEEKAAENKEKIHWVKYVLHKAPSKQT